MARKGSRAAAPIKIARFTGDAPRARPPPPGDAGMQRRVRVAVRTRPRGRGVAGLPGAPPAAGIVALPGTLPFRAGMPPGVGSVLQENLLLSLGRRERTAG
ncbi:hypothetical protein mvi_33880 [Methylobacterium indicum]|uniref:Uncharacterized protein n=1 Tax=Methylobacterium indicum TaxID=1775910 RepID=A0A8H8WVJ6_9HYPH|nr:hypothetical protein mvi_33880 [Methylobacterium indicum]